jgi:hypothetical protein
VIFLVVYDTNTATLIEIKEYEEHHRDQAMDWLNATQERLIDNLDHLEVALFEAPSRATLEQTHSRYFKSFKELGESLSEAARKPA